MIVKEYPPKGATVNTVKSHVQKCVDMGHKPDLIVIDYVENRYGQDGMTYNIKMDTNNGHIVFEGKADASDLLDDGKPIFNLSSESMSTLFEKK